MKSKALPFLLALFLASPTGFAQSEAPTSTIKVTTSLNKDGTKTVVKTDPEGHTATTRIYSATDKLLQKTVINLDEQGTPVGGAVYVPRGTTKTGAIALVLVYKMQYKRDNFNRLGEVENYSPTDQLLSRQVYHYDANSRIVRIDNFDAAGNPIGDTASQARPDKKR